jgi:small subunit ribosomal protein S1
LFVGLDGDIDGMVHLSDLSWDKDGEAAVADFKKGDIVKAKILDVDIEKERISLGVKQLTEDPFAEAMGALKRGQIVTCVVKAVLDAGLEVTINEGVTGFIKKNEIAKERSEQRPDRFAVGEKVDARITALDAKTRKLQLSIKAREVAEEKEAMAEYGSTDSGASLGDILGAALKRKQGDDDDDDDDDGPDDEPVVEEPVAGEPEAKESAEPEEKPDAS